MELYCSDYLSISKRGHTLIQKWSNKELSPEKFKEELQQFSDVAQKESPKSTLWLHENFKLNIPSSLYNWMEDSITSKQYHNGMRKIAFTVSPEVKSHISVINSFGQVQSVVNPMFFVNSEEALEFIESEETIGNLISPPPNFDIQLEEETNMASFEMKMHINDVPKILNTLNRIQVEKKLVISELRNFNNLTYREKEVMRYISLGYTNQQIADEMFISSHTVKNHRKKIISKLEISSSIEFHQYARAFRLIHF